MVVFGAELEVAKPAIGMPPRRSSCTGCHVSAELANQLFPNGPCAGTFPCGTGELCEPFRTVFFDRRLIGDEFI